MFRMSPYVVLLTAGLDVALAPLPGSSPLETCLSQSSNAVSFEWKFGDGTYSDEENPIHIYTGTGSYQVELKAISESGNYDKAFMTIDVRIPTLLEIEVREWSQDGNGNVVPDASVILYPTLSDWDNQTNSVAE